MSQAKPDLAAALADVSGSSRRRPAPLRAASPSVRVKAAPEKPSGVPRAADQASTIPPSRIGTVPITGHFPPEVRDHLKILAIERRATLHDLMAEAYNDLFAKYGKPEIAPRKGGNR